MTTDDRVIRELVILSGNLHRLSITLRVLSYELSGGRMASGDSVSATRGDAPAAEKGGLTIIGMGPEGPLLFPEED